MSNEGKFTLKPEELINDQGTINSVIDKIKGNISTMGDIMKEIAGNGDVWMGKQRDEIMASFEASNPKHLAFADSLHSVGSHIKMVLDVYRKIEADRLNALGEAGVVGSSLPTSIDLAPIKYGEARYDKVTDFSKYVHNGTITITSEEQLKSLGPGKHKVRFKIGGKEVEGDILIPAGSTNNKGLVACLPGGSNGLLSNLISNGKMEMPDKIVFSPYYAAVSGKNTSYQRFTTEDFHEKVAFIEKALGVDSTKKTLIGHSVGAQLTKNTVKNEGYNGQWENIMLLDAGFLSTDDQKNGKTTGSMTNFNNNVTVIAAGLDFSGARDNTTDAANALGAPLIVAEGMTHNNTEGLLKCDVVSNAIYNY